MPFGHTDLTQWPICVCFPFMQRESLSRCAAFGPAAATARGREGIVANACSAAGPGGRHHRSHPLTCRASPRTKAAEETDMDDVERSIGDLVIANRILVLVVVVVVFGF